MTNDNAYKKAGVDIHAAADLVENIKPHIKKTNRSGVMSGIGGFGALFDLKETGYKDPIIVSATDGVGTKIKIAIDLDSHDTIGIDAVAMCVNDLIVQGAEPLFFLDYFACGKLNGEVAEKVIASIAKGCEESGCALIGGETAEMPGLYAEGDYDIAGFSVGAVEREDIIDGSEIAEGDILLGLSSSGLHSNGFSLVRHIIAEDPDLDFSSRTPFDENKSLGELCLTPTRIYARAILAALKIRNDKGRSAINGMSHITGGGLYENIPRMLSDDLAAELDASTWKIPNIFKYLAKLGSVSNDDMALTLNCGIGFVIACAPEHADEIKAVLESENEHVSVIGKITKRDNAKSIVKIEKLDFS